MITRVVDSDTIYTLKHTGIDRGTGDVTLGLRETGVAAGVYNEVQVDRYGRVVAAWKRSYGGTVNAVLNQSSAAQNASFWITGTGVVGTGIGLGRRTEAPAVTANTLYNIEGVLYWDGGQVSAGLPVASATVLGGIKVGANLSIDATGVLSAAGGSVISGLTTYGVVVAASATEIMSTDALMFNTGTLLFKDNIVVDTQSASASVHLGYQAGQGSVGAEGTVFLGAQAGTESAATYSLFSGPSAGYQSSGSYIYALGQAAALSMSSSSHVVAFGTYAGGGATGFSETVAIGVSAGSGSSSVSSSLLAGRGAGSTGSYSLSGVVAIGSYAMANAAHDMVNSVGIGSHSTDGASSWSWSAALGSNSGLRSTVIADTLMLGYNAGMYTENLHSCVIIGRDAGQHMTNQHDNICIGESAGAYMGYGTTGSIISPSGENNICIGVGAGAGGTSSYLVGSNNILIGYWSGNAYGHDGAYEVSNQVIIDPLDHHGANESSTAFIYGLAHLDASQATLSLNSVVTARYGLVVASGDIQAPTDGVVFASAGAAPLSTTDRLYNVDGVLYWNGSAIGSGGGYTLPTASATVLGGIKVGTGLAIDGSGVLSATGGSVPANVVTTDTAQTITGAKTFDSIWLSHGAPATKTSALYNVSGQLWWSDAAEGTAIIARTFAAVASDYSQLDISWQHSYGAWVGRLLTNHDFVLGALASGNTVVPALTFKNTGYAPYRADFSVPLTLASSTPASTTNALYNVSGALYWNGAAVAVGTPANMVTTDTVQTITGAKTFSTAGALTAYDITVSTGDIYVDCTDAGSNVHAYGFNFRFNNVYRTIFRWNEQYDRFELLTRENSGSQRDNRMLIPRTSALPTEFNAAGGVQITQGGLLLSPSVPSTTGSKLYNNAGVLSWAGSAVVTASSAATLSSLTISSAQPANALVLRARPQDGATNANLLIDMYSSWSGGTYFGPALYFGRSNGNGWFTSTPGTFFFSGVGQSGTAENMYFGAASAAVVSAAQCALVIEANTQKVFFGGLLTSGSTRRSQMQGGAYIADSGLELAATTVPASTTNTIYNIGGTLYWNGGVLVPDRPAIDNSTPSSSVSMTAAWVNRHSRLAPTAAVNVVVEPGIAVVGDQLWLLQANTTFFTLTAGAGVTLNCATSQATISPRARYSELRLLCVAEDTYDVSGDFLP